MTLQLGEFIAKVLLAVPADKVFSGADIGILVRYRSSDIVFRQGQVLQGQEEVRVERIVVLAVLQAWRVHIPRNDVEVEVVHAWVGVETHPDLLGEVTPWRQLVRRRRRVRFHRFNSLALLDRVG